MRIKVPASIANIGPGFDCMAMAIDLWLEVEANESNRPSWDYEGEGADYLYAHENPFTRLNMKGRVPRCWRGRSSPNVRWCWAKPCVTAFTSHTVSTSIHGWRR